MAAPSSRCHLPVRGGKLAKFIGGVRVGEATRPGSTRRCVRCAARMAPRWRGRPRRVLRGGLQLAVMANVLGANPVRDVSPIKSKGQPTGAKALTADQLRDLLAKLGASDYCHAHDLADPLILLIATGLRRSELLGLRWSDYDDQAGTITVAGKVVRVAGKGLVRVDETKTAPAAA